MALPQFSVLMSLYIKEKPAYFEQCMQSVLGQTVLPDEIVIVEDGPLTGELEQMVQRFADRYPQLIKVLPLPVNEGLWHALAVGVPTCSHELIARVDTDDICRADRFEKQLALFQEDPSLDICGSHIQEFCTSPDEIVSVRKVPLDHEGIARYQKRRTAFNHMTVMYKKSAVLRAGNYRNVPLMEDDDLWVRMLMSGARCGNIDDCLVLVRVGDALSARRGGYSYFLKYKAGRKKILEMGYIGRTDYYVTLLAQFIVAMMPARMRMFVYRKFLRKE